MDLVSLKFESEHAPDIDLQVAINRFVAETNADPNALVWTADPKTRARRFKRGKQTLETVH
jgi:hypothetical protein